MEREVPTIQETATTLVNTFLIAVGGFLESMNQRIQQQRNKGLYFAQRETEVSHTLYSLSTNGRIPEIAARVINFFVPSVEPEIGKPREFYLDQIGIDTFEVLCDCADILLHRNHIGFTSETQGILWEINWGTLYVSRRTSTGSHMIGKPHKFTSKRYPMTYPARFSLYVGFDDVDKSRVKTIYVSQTHAIHPYIARTLELTRLSDTFMTGTSMQYAIARTKPKAA